MDQNSTDIANILTNSKAYQFYNQSMKSLKERCEEYANQAINEIETYIRKSCLPNGVVNLNFSKVNYKDVYTPKEKQKQYLTPSELEIIKDHFEVDGFKVNFIFPKKYKIIKRIFKKYNFSFPIKIIINVNWDFKFIIGSGDSNA